MSNSLFYRDDYFKQLFVHQSWKNLQKTITSTVSTQMFHCDISYTHEDPILANQIRKFTWGHMRGACEVA